MPRFNYRWKLSDGYPAKGVEKHNKTVLSTFACGGGSSMGYKLAGYDVI
jgi:DNA (cytosine-5)-methyltransferase 1